MKDKPSPTPERYYDVLCTIIDMWLTIYALFWEVFSP